MLLKGNCLELLKSLPDASVDSVVTDPPYELGFMGKSWDNSGIAYNQDLWAECLRVLKPGGHLLAFSGSRTYHRMTVAIEDAGFEIRDQIMWLYGSGFPKSKNVALAIDKGEGHPNRGKAIPTASKYQASDVNETNKLTSNPVPPYKAKSEVAQQWQGWGTALKPAFEPVAIAQKPYANKDFCERIGSHFASIEAWLQQVLEKQTPTGEAVGSSAQTATSQSEWEATTFLSTVTSWLNILEEIYQHENTFITSTTSNTTTDWKTLCSLALKITPESITKAQTEPSGLVLIASAVDNLLAAAVLSWRGILGLSAIETATGNTAPKRRGEGAVSHEPIVVARKPLIGTVANNVLTYGTGALNIDGSRVGASGENFDNLKGRPVTKLATRRDGETDEEYNARVLESPEQQKALAKLKELGRWPANVIHDGSDEVLEGFPESKGGTYPAKRGQAVNTTFASGQETEGGYRAMGDSGSAARYFYCAKASKSERNAGLEGFEERRESDRVKDDGAGGNNPRNRTNEARQNFHPTVKPLALMRYLIRLVTPPQGVVLDPFLGSGTTAVAAILEGFDWVGCEMTEDYWPIIEARVSWAENQKQEIPTQPDDNQQALF
jgi:DNA modification methylase